MNFTSTFEVRRSKFDVRIYFFIAILVLIGCDRPSPPVARPTVAAGNCTVRGIVTFIGSHPTFKIIGGDCCPGSTPVEDESLAINSNGSMKNVVVFIKDGPNIDLPPPADALLTQRNCQYVPHVLALRTGQKLVITSHDATMHNVHIEGESNPQQNFSQPINATNTVTFQHPEQLRIKCDVHPWMTAYSYIFDHPCFAVTGDDGRFEISHLPAGTYTLMAWQEKLQSQEMTITVTPDKPLEVKFEYHGS